MVDAERILGSLVRNAMGGGRRRGRRRRRRRSGLLGGVGRGTLALGALGVAIGAFEHLSQKRSGGGSLGASPPGPPPPPPGPPTPGAGAAATGAVPPPPPPGAPERADEALLLVRAMIAAANADHHVDEAERARIVEALEAAEASAEDRAYVLRELESPASMAQLAAQATTPELAGEVYMASLMAIDLDTEAERNYLQRLAARLGLPDERVRELEGLLEGEGPASGVGDSAE